MSSLKIKSALILMAIACFSAQAGRKLTVDPIGKVFPGNPYATNPKTCVNTIKKFLVDRAAAFTYVTSKTGYPTFFGIPLAFIHERLFGAPDKLYSQELSLDSIDENAPESLKWLKTLADLKVELVKLSMEMTKQEKAIIKGRQSWLDSSMRLTEKEKAILLNLGRELIEVEAKHKKLAEEQIQVDEKLIEVDAKHKKLAAELSSFQKPFSLNAHYKESKNEDGSVTILATNSFLNHPVINDRESPYVPLFNCVPPDSVSVLFTSGFLNDMRKKYPAEDYPGGVNILSLFVSGGLNTLSLFHSPTHFACLHISCLKVTLKNNCMDVTHFDSPLKLPIIIYDRNQGHHFFEKIAKEMHIDRTFSYVPLGHQIINGADCGRFSFVYLLSLLYDKDPRELTAYDIYTGMRYLTEQGYEEFHEKLQPGEIAGVRKIDTMSKCAQFTSLLKRPLEYFLKSVRPLEDRQAALPTGAPLNLNDKEKPGDKIGVVLNALDGDAALNDQLVPAADNAVAERGAVDTSSDSKEENVLAADRIGSDQIQRHNAVNHGADDDRQQ